MLRSLFDEAACARRPLESRWNLRMVETRSSKPESGSNALVRVLRDLTAPSNIRIWPRSVPGDSALAPSEVASEILKCVRGDNDHKCDAPIVLVRIIKEIK